MSAGASQPGRPADEGSVDESGRRLPGAILWIGFGSLLSLAVMHLDLGLCGSLFLPGQKLWKDEGSGVEETTRLPARRVSAPADYGKVNVDDRGE